MREIKFRAKTTVKEDKSHAFNNVWVEGDLIVSNGRYYIHTRANKVNVDNDLGKFIVMHEVQKDTVCEYTGLKDKNGKEIYENDLIMQYDYKGDRWEIRQIIYSDHSLNLGWCMKGIKKINKYNISELCTVGIGPRDTERCEVIGNIFDNPELLEGGAE